MLSFLKDHPFAVEAFFESSLVFTYAIPKEQIQPMIPECLELDTLLSAVHEIRSNDEKVQFLKECYRICKPNGKVIMVEHLRDVPNFLAFSIGFTHFFSHATWKAAFEQAGFSTFRETKFTPFMSVFNCTP